MTSKGLRLRHQAFDGSLLSLVCSGSVSLDLYDDPHALARAPEAVGESLRYWSESGGGGCDSVGHRLSPGQVALIGSSSSQRVGRDPIGFVTARCNPAVAAADCVYDDGHRQRILAVAGAATEQHWMV